MKAKSKACAIGAAVAIAAMGVSPMAFAATESATPTNMNNATSGDSQAKILKEVRAGSSADIAGKVFTFTFTGLPVDTSEVGSQPATDIKIDSVQLATKAMKSTSDVQFIEGKIILPDVSKFPAAGIYRFEVKETAWKGAADEGWKLSQASYIMKVYVENNSDNDNLHYKGVTVEKTKVDDGSEGSGKIDPTDPNWKDTNVPGKGEDGTETTNATASSLAFVNTYEDNDNELKLSKQVTGNYGDKTKLFDYTVEITVPSYVTITDSIAVAATQSNSDSSKNPTRTVDGKKITITGIQLKDNGEYTITGLPIGSTYKVTETGVAHYVASAKFKNPSGTEVSVAAAAEGASEVVSVAQESGTAVAQTTTIGNGPSTVDFTNAYDDTDITPTGIAMQVIPYVLLIAIPVALIVGTRVKKRDEDDE